MYQKLLHFIKYNNAFTLIVVMCFLGSGIAFAANPDLREEVYASEETVVSIDNRMVVTADLDNFPFNLRITSVTEDEKNYYATYSFTTMIIEESVWQEKEIEKMLTVSKVALEGKDLGLYVAKELGENIKYELSYLKRVQKLEREKGESKKVVTIEYSGLVGKMLDPKEMVIEGYNPVVPEIVKEEARPQSDNAASVIVSTPYVEVKETPAPKNEQPAEQQAAPAAVPAVNEVRAPQPEPAATTTELVTDETPVPIPEPTPIVEQAETPLPAPEEMINEEKVQEVVEELLEEATVEEAIEPALPTEPPTEHAE